MQIDAAYVCIHICTYMHRESDRERERASERERESESESESESSTDRHMNPDIPRPLDRA